MPDSNFDVNQLVSPLAQKAKDEQKRNAAMRKAGATVEGPGPQPKQVFENQEYKDTRRAQEQNERQMIKQRLRDNTAKP